MKTTLITSVLALTGSVLASAIPAEIEERTIFNCVSQSEANTFVQNFASILAKQNSSYGTPAQTANALLANNFVEASNSVLSLQGLSLNGDGLSAHSKAEWINGVVNFAPPYGGIVTNKVLVACDQILWYWTFNKIGSGKYPVKGFNLFTITRTGPSTGILPIPGLQVSKLELEFDSIAWGNDDGEVTCTVNPRGG